MKLVYQISRIRLFISRMVRKHFSSIKSNWEYGKKAQLDFWEKTLKDNGRNWYQPEFNKRISSSSEFDKKLRNLILDTPYSKINKYRIVDVGAGPLTDLGKKWPGKELEIIPLDPLANYYNKILKNNNIIAPVPTIYGEGEKLLEVWSESSFHMAYSANALDHSISPLRCIKNMVKITKPSCYVWFWTFVNEAEKSGYSGFHQWNFIEQNGDLLIWNARNKISLAKELSGVATVSCTRNIKYEERERPILEIAIKKL